MVEERKHTLEYYNIWKEGGWTNVFLPTNHMRFDIKMSVWNNLNHDKFEGKKDQDPYEHLSKFYETC